jgi:energy-coupling factor transport system permease protein
MFRLSQFGQAHAIHLNESSPLRHLDPRSKLALSSIASLAVMLPFERLVIFLVTYLIFILWAKLLNEMARQVWRLKWILVVLFIVDWWLVSLELAAIITLRLVLLAGVFALFFSTTTPSELGLALEKLKVPYRFSFSLNLAFQSLGLLQEEWNTIREAQKSRGVHIKIQGFKTLVNQIGDLVALTVPAIVLTTRRAWAITEAAYARGFDSPHRISYYQLNMKFIDWVFLIIPVFYIGILLLWR